MLITLAWSCPIGVWKYSALNLTIYFHRAFVVETWLAGFALQRVKKKRQVYCQKPLQKQHNAMLSGVKKFFEKWQQRRQNKCAMLEIVGVAGLKCKDVEDLTVSLEDMSSTTLSFWLSKFVCEVPK